jgi:hypothetical protein
MLNVSGEFDNQLFKKIVCLLWKENIHYKIQSLDPALSQMKVSTFLYMFRSF